MSKQANFDLVLFGATGDLAMRKLLPCLYQRMPPACSTPKGVFCVSRSDFTTAQFLQKVESDSKIHIKTHFSDELWAFFIARIQYLMVDATRPETVKPWAKPWPSAPTLIMWWCIFPPRRNSSRRFAKTWPTSASTAAKCAWCWKTAGHRPEIFARNQCRRGRGILSRRPNLPHRPLSGQRSAAKLKRAALCQRKAGAFCGTTNM